ncbi:carboxypeptidase inhibitor SmCI-like [Styela clava]
MKIFAISCFFFIGLKLSWAQYSTSGVIEITGTNDKVDNPDCLERPIRGRCSGSYQRWYYNPKTIKCKKFKYGGCGGNNNRFFTWGQCILQCPYKKSTNLDCTEPKVVGPCYSSLRRFYYNTVTERCEVFHYGGCKGSKNRFLTRRECESNCPAKQGCLEPKKRGPCGNYSSRYYFNRRTRQCERFIYGGCQANENNFLSKEECEKKCPVEVRKAEFTNQIFF